MWHRLRRRRGRGWLDGLQKRLRLLVRFKQPRGGLEHHCVTGRGGLEIGQTMRFRKDQRLIENRSNSLLLFRAHDRLPYTQQLLDPLNRSFSVVHALLGIGDVAVL